MAYISIGGIDGSGKSTIQRLIVDRLASKGRGVISFAEPYHSFVKELLEVSGDPWTDVLLFAADRWLLKPRILQWASEGKVLVASRSLYCSVAYQGAQGIPWDDILCANRWESLILPDVFLILDLDPHVAYSRCSGKEKFEEEEFLASVRAQYIEIHRQASRFPSKIILVDASRSIDEVFQSCIDAIRLASPGLAE